MKAPHIFAKLTEACIWCGFTRAHCDDSPDKLALCPIPAEKRRYREIQYIDGTVLRVPLNASAPPEFSHY